MADYLNGFTILSFNYQNKYVTLKTENYYFDSIPTISHKNIINRNVNRNINNVSYWILNNFDTNTYVIISGNIDNYEENDLIAGPLYDKNNALILLNFFNDLKGLKN